MAHNDILRPRPWGGGNPELWQLKYEVADDRFLQIFRDFGRLIRRSEEACEKAAAQKNAEYEQFVAESESEYIEEIIGSSFLVLQAKIRRVTSSALALRGGVQARHNVGIPEFADPASIRGLGGRFKRKKASLVQLVWDVGNYYKHRDEWPPAVWRNNRAKKKDRHERDRRTRRSVERLGIVYASTGNMRTAYEFFGIDPYSKCEQLAEQVQGWATQVYTTAQSRLQAHVAQSQKAAAPVKATAKVAA
jgi:hypothetical protein